jgi:hypothetical protein
MNRCVSCAAVLLGVLVGLSSPAYGDGGFFPPVGVEDPTSPSQRALIIHDGATQTLIVQTQLSAQAEGYAWVVPVPANPSSFTTRSELIFEELRERTQPRIYIVEPHGSGGGLGCDCSSSRSSDMGTAGAAVHVWQELQVGPYDIAVVSSPDPNALIDWLNTNGYTFPPTAVDIVDWYVQKSWCFVAVRLSVQAPATGGLKPLEIVFDTAEIVYPMRISSLSSDAECEVRLYMLADHRTECVELPTRELNPHKGPVYPTYGYDDILFPQARGSFIVEYAGWIAPADVSGTPLEPLISKTYFLTRMTTVLTPQEMDGDFTFVAAAADDPCVIDTVVTYPLASAPPSRHTPPVYPLTGLTVLCYVLFLALMPRRKKRALAWATAASLMLAFMLL